MAPKHKNSPVSNESRTENVIRHPQENYAEVSVRSIRAIQKKADNIRNGPSSTKSDVALAVWTACLGAVLGYIPSVVDMVHNQYLENSIIIYILVIIVGIISFEIRRHLKDKYSSSLESLLSLISDELSEERIPINQGLNLTNTNIPVENRSNSTVNNKLDFQTKKEGE